ncbi:MAG: NYN domain-containing protein [Gammaproteobacteria bacterium]|nr:MAG: NYN domain-containing protein [Gammaproteobacteria bacterium]RKZ71931.1 MAG: NYN domain-containing protein [Gammaproteobacteria bacterium]
MIDLENCPNQIDKLQQDLVHFSQVIICYAHSGVKIPLDWLVPLSTAVNENKLKIYKMANGGKNSADFGISFFAGALMQESKKRGDFVIVSNDTDLDHVVALLRSQGCSAERIGILKEQKINTVTNCENTLPIKDFCMYLTTNNKNRPAKKETLLNTITSKFKNTNYVAEDILKLLVKNGVLKISNNIVKYYDEKIVAISK